MKNYNWGNQGDANLWVSLLTYIPAALLWIDGLTQSRIHTSVNLAWLLASRVTEQLIISKPWLSYQYISSHISNGMLKYLILENIWSIAVLSPADGRTCLYLQKHHVMLSGYATNVY